MKRFKKSVSLILALLLTISMVYTGPATTVQAATPSVTANYAAFLSVKTTRAVELKEAAGSAASKYTIPADTMLTVQELQQLSDGSYWYKVSYYGLTLYVDATATTMVDHLTGDIKVTDLMSPAALGLGQGFPIGGTISSSFNQLSTVTAAVHHHSNITSTPAISSSDTIGGKSYTMDDSKLDQYLIFSDLAAGSYTYLLTTEVVSYYIDDAGALATSIQTVVLDNKPLIVTDANDPNPVIAKGIDVSVHQGRIDWASVAPQVDFAILRIGFETTLDTQFTNNAAGCNANGVPFGVYIYSYAESEAEAIAEANFVINALKNYDVDLPIFFDIEDQVHRVLSSTEIQNIVKAFCDTIRDAGYEPGLYTFLSWFNSYFGGSYYNSLPKWVAQIDVSKCSYAKGLTMWQYSWTGSFSGISGDVDCNYYYGEFPGKSTDKSYLASCDHYPSNLDVTVHKAVDMREYPSSDYSVIDELAVGTKLHVTGLYKNTYGNCWYEVDHDGVTGYVGADYVTVDGLRYDDISVTAPTMTDLALNSGYYLKGRLGAKYNDLHTVHAKVYNGEDTLGSPVLISSATAKAKSYVLNYSDVCDGMIFSDLEVGYYTYEISADVKNYYVSGGSLTSETKNVVVWTKPFTVGGATIEPPASVVCDHVIVTQPGYAATCTTDGLSDGTHCSKCGAILTKQTVIKATGHSYTTQTLPATCIDFEKLKHTCSGCGDTYTTYADDMDQLWSETKPEGLEESQIRSKVQYRYADFKTFTSGEPSVAGYTQLSKTWKKTGSGSVQYVDSWPTGYDTSHSLYGQYDQSKKTASETATDKTVVESNGIIGNVFYHWCLGTYTAGPINRSTSPTKTDRYNTFHSFYAGISTVDPTTLTQASDTSVTYPNADACTDSHWWYFIPVYEQKYTTYEAEFTYEGWGEWSAWSDPPVTASDSRKVETRTVYLTDPSALGAHSYVDGVCSLCGAEDPDAGCKHTAHDPSGICTACGESVGHSYVGGACAVCGKAEPAPTIQPTFSSVSFEDEVVLNIYFTIAEMEGVALKDMGLLTWTTPQNNGTIENAQKVIPGAVGDGTTFMVCSEGIPAKKLGDLVYFRVYAKLADGTYVYSAMYSTSPKSYAMGRIRNSSDPYVRSICVAMLNYGAEAQKYFSYRPYSLMNSELTAAEKALVAPYEASMVSKLPAVDSVKSSKIPFNGGFSALRPSVSFDEAFSLNFYFTPTYEVDSTVQLYYWSAEDYASASYLTLSNATGVFDGEPVEDTANYWGAISGIAAKEIDRPWYFVGVYQSGGLTYTTGVRVYSLGTYCAAMAAKEDSEIKDFAAATAVYGHYAKAYFEEVYSRA